MTIHHLQPWYPVPEFMQEEPLITENPWQRLEAEECGCLQMVEEANEDTYSKEDEGFDETL